MTMRKKDYEAIARAIKTVHDRQYDHQEIFVHQGARFAALKIADYCATQDPTFKRDRFLADCGVNQS